MTTPQPALVVVQNDDPNPPAPAECSPLAPAPAARPADRHGYRYEPGEDRIDIPVFAQETHRFGGGAWALQRPPRNEEADDFNFRGLVDWEMDLVLGELGPNCHGWLNAELARRPRLNGRHPIKAWVPSEADMGMARSLMLAGQVELIFLSAPLALQFARTESLQAAAEWLSTLPGTTIFSGITGMVRAGDGTVECHTWPQPPRGLGAGRNGSDSKAQRRALHTAFAATVIAACTSMQVPLREAMALGRANRAVMEMTARRA